MHIEVTAQSCPSLLQKKLCKEIFHEFLHLHGHRPTLKFLAKELNTNYSRAFRVFSLNEKMYLGEFLLSLDLLRRIKKGHFYGYKGRAKNQRGSARS